MSIGCGVIYTFASAGPFVTSIILGYTAKGTPGSSSCWLFILPCPYERGSTSRLLGFLQLSSSFILLALGGSAFHKESPRRAQASHYWRRRFREAEGGCRHWHTTFATVRGLRFHIAPILAIKLRVANLLKLDRSEDSLPFFRECQRRTPVYTVRCQFSRLFVS